MRLEAGAGAPAFTAETVRGDTISLESFVGRFVLLMFFRYASCPMCNLRLHDFARNHADLRRRGLDVVAFFHSPARSIRAHAGRKEYPFHLVADPRMNVYRAWGVETSWPRFLSSMVRPGFYVDWVRAMRHGYWGGMAVQMASMPADFLIGPDQRILRAHYGRDIGDHLPVREIESLLRPAGGSDLPQDLDERP